MFPETSLTLIPLVSIFHELTNDDSDVRCSQSPTTTIMTAADERQPLLPPAALASDEEVQRPSEEENLEQTAEVEPVKTERTWWTIIWYAVLTALGVFFLVLFVKGFIDADDVEVCL